MQNLAQFFINMDHNEQMMWAVIFIVILYLIIGGYKK